jgi:hypothetical protein
MAVRQHGCVVRARHLRDGCPTIRIYWGTNRGRRQGSFFSNRYFLGCKGCFDLPVVLVSNFVFRRKRILGELKAYLRATDHTSSNIISRDLGLPSEKYKIVS